VTEDKMKSPWDDKEIKGTYDTWRSTLRNYLTAEFVENDTMKRLASMEKQRLVDYINKETSRLSISDLVIAIRNTKETAEQELLILLYIYRIQPVQGKLRLISGMYKAAVADNQIAIDALLQIMNDCKDKNEMIKVAEATLNKLASHGN